ncbi:amino acid permease-domain-containing protein [Lactarius vividus]|nr:amino acid permease-domain-containing protein [Lactarius vividus]
MASEFTPAISYGTIKPSSSHRQYDEDTPKHPQALPSPSIGALHRGLSSRQVQMIAIAGTIGTGLFVGTGNSLAQGGPASMLICYSIVGFIVYITLLLLGEMATQYPVAGSFNIYVTRFFSPAYGFALSWNYWLNQAVGVASGLTAAQLVLEFWSFPNPWIFSLTLWVFLVFVNAIHVGAYGELEYWLSSLKVVTIVIFILLGILVNVGVNQEHRFIGFENWQIPGAPFVGGFGGFAHVFVTASFAFGGTESLGITAGETKNPGKNIPRIVKFVFWRIMLFYLLSILLIGLNVPWDYPNLSNKTATTSPFTVVFKQFGSTTAASFMNTVILSSVISAGNQGLFAGTRVLYGLATASHAPSLFAWTTRGGVPLPALLLTSSFSALCFGSSFIGNGQLWAWLQTLLGVSSQIAWLSIGFASWRFRTAWKTQGRPLSEMKFRALWTWPWGPPFVITTVSAILLIQGWSSVIPRFSAVDFFSFYIELPVMALMYLLWLLVQRMRHLPASPRPAQPFFDFVDVTRVDLYHDEHEEGQVDEHEDEVRAQRLCGRARWAWAAYYLIA